MFNLLETHANSMNCLHCDATVPLLQSLVHRRVPFCCDDHRKAYVLETQRLMLARLMETLPIYSKDRIRDARLPYQPTNATVEDRTRAIALRPLVTG